MSKLDNESISTLFKLGLVTPRSISFEPIDEDSLDKTARLGLAFCRVNCGLWDELLGPKPTGFDELPRFSKDPKFPWQKKKPSKSDFTRGPSKAIESIIGEANASKYWCIFVVGMSEEEWFRWFTTERRWGSIE